MGFAAQFNLPKFTHRLKASGIFQEDGRTLMVAADHPYFGYIKVIGQTEKVLPPLADYADAFMIAPGTLQHYGELLGGKPIVLRASGCVSTEAIPRSVYEQELIKWIYKQQTGKNFDEVFRNYITRLENKEELESEELEEYEKMYLMVHEEDAMAKERLIISAAGARRLRASAVAVSAYIGSRGEDQTLANVVDMADQADYIDIPLLGVEAVGKRMGRIDPHYLAKCARILAEHRADFVKIHYLEGFDYVVENCPVPVVVGGGPIPKGLTNEEEVEATLKMAYDALNAGARGIDFGRRVWENKHPEAMIKALRSIVHEKADYNEANELYLEGVRKVA